MATKRSDQRLIVGGSPRAELLPPELKQQERARAQRRLLGLIVVLVLVVVGGGYAYSALVAETSRQRLAEAQAHGDELLVEQAKYIDARLLAAQVKASDDARTVGMSQEIDWRAHFTLLALSLSSMSGLIGGFDVVAASPLTPATPPDAPLENPSVASVSVVVKIIDYPNIALWFDTLKTFPGYTDGTITAITQEGSTYTVNAVIHLDEQAFTNRFNPDAQAEDDADDTDTDTDTDESSEDSE